VHSAPVQLPPIARPQPHLTRVPAVAPAQHEQAPVPVAAPAQGFAAPPLSPPLSG
jgi:hypothetical protein